MIDSMWFILLKSTLGLLLIAALIFLWQIVLKKYGAKLSLIIPNNKNIIILGSITLPNRSQLIHIEDCLLKNTHLISISPNGNMLLISSEKNKNA